MNSQRNRDKHLDSEMPVWRPSDNPRYGEDYNEGPSPASELQSGDRKIEAEIRESLNQHAHLAPSGIIIDVTDGEVTLTGQVENIYMKQIAEDLALDAIGVTGVQNKLLVVDELLSAQGI